MQMSIVFNIWYGKMGNSWRYSWRYSTDINHKVNRKLTIFPSVPLYAKYTFSLVLQSASEGGSSTPASLRKNMLNQTSQSSCCKDVLANSKRSNSVNHKMCGLWIDLLSFVPNLYLIVST